MKDKMSINSINKPANEFTEYLHDLLGEIIIEGESFGRFKKWLKKYCDEYGVDYVYIETEITDFIELVDEYAKSRSSLIMKMLYKSSGTLYLSKMQVDTILKKTNSKQLEKKAGSVTQTPLRKNENENKKRRRANNERENDFNNAVKENTISAYKSFLNKYTAGSKYTVSVENRLTKLVQQKTNKTASSNKLRKPNTKKPINVRQQYKSERETDFDNAINKNTISAFADFIYKYKNGQYIEEARNRKSLLVNNAMHYPDMGSPKAPTLQSEYNLLNTDIEQTVKNIIMDKLGVSEYEITRNSSFANDFAADSLDQVELIMEFEKEFDISIPDEIAERINTVGQAIDLLKQNT